MSFTAGIMDLRDHERRTIGLKERNNFTLFLMYLTTVVHYVWGKKWKKELNQCFGLCKAKGINFCI